MEKLNNKSPSIDGIENSNNLNKETRWGRITKKHLNSVKITTKNVQRIFNMNFVDERQIKSMTKDKTLNQNGINPVLVMNMRHEMIRRGTKNPSKILNVGKLNKMDNIKNHNNTVEERYLDNELKKFREKFNHVHEIDDDFMIPPKCHDKLLNIFDNSTDTVDDNHDDGIGASSNSSTTLERQIDWDSILLQQSTITPTATTAAVPAAANFNDSANKGLKTVKFENCKNFIDLKPTTKSLGFHQNCCGISEITDGIVDNATGERNGNQWIVDETDKHLNRTPLLAIEIVKKKKLTKLKDSLQLIGKQIHEDPILINVAQDESGISSSSDVSEKQNISSRELLDSRNVDRNRSAGLANKHHQQYSIVVDDEKPLVEQESIIDDLFHNTLPSKGIQKIILQKYFTKWTHYTTIEKLTNQNTITNASRSQKIQSFLNSIRLEKKKLIESKDFHNHKDEASKDSKVPGDTRILARKYQNKLKIQQDIIDLQKLKLDRQERMITELKFSKITDEMAQSRNTVKDELKSVVKNGSIAVRSKARCLQMNLRKDNGGDNDDDDENGDSYQQYLQLQAKGMPKFLIDMQTRALERETRHREASERREKLEREKEEQRLAAEDAKHRLDEEAKQKRIEELREKRRQERLAKELKETNRLVYLDNVNKANQHYRKYLLTKLGFNRFKLLIKIKKRNIKKAIRFYQIKLLKFIIKKWIKQVADMWQQRKQIADNCYHKNLKLFTFKLWRKYQLTLYNKMLVAIDWSDMKSLEINFRYWDGYNKQCKLLDEVKFRQADAHYKWHLKWRVIDHWQRLHVILKIEKETDQRRQRWRMKIWELIPDYTPGDVDISNKPSICALPLAQITQTTVNKRNDKLLTISPTELISCEVGNVKNVSSCSFCNRNFSTDRIEIHEIICRKIASKEFEISNGKCQVNKMMGIGHKENSECKKIMKSNNWRKNHATFIDRIRETKKAHYQNVSKDKELLTGRVTDKFQEI